MCSSQQLPKLKAYFPLLLAWLGLLFTHRAGWWGGQLLGLEDVAAQFFSLKSRLYLLAHGQEGWSFWDPLCQLGVPRLANIQQGWLSPFSLWFALVPPSRAWALYPALVDSVLLLSAFFALRRVGCSTLSSTWAGALWVGSGNVLNSTQSPCFKEGLVVACLTLGLMLEWWQRPRRRTLVSLAVAGAIHWGVGNPTVFFYNNLSLSVAFVVLGWQRKVCWKLMFAGAVAYLSGFFWAAPSWLAMQDFVSHSHRTLLEVTESEFAESGRLPMKDGLLRLFGESYAYSSQPIKNDLNYSLLVDLSAAASLLALSSAGLNRLRPLLLLALALMIQASGEAGGLLWCLHRLVPFTLKVRGAQHFILLATLLWLAVAGMAWDHWRTGRKAQWANALALWAWFFCLSVPGLRFGQAYVPAELFSPPPFPPAGFGRMAVLRLPPTIPPLPWLSSPPLQGRGVMAQPDSLLDREYLKGLANSQFGDGADGRIKLFLLRGGMVPILRPESPLLQSWGLTWVLEGKDGLFSWKRVQQNPLRFWMADPIFTDEATWARRQKGDPYAQAQVGERGIAPLGGKVSPLLVHEDLPDRQVLDVTGPGLLVTNDQWDQGWICRVDDREVPSIRANLAQKACQIGPGKHRVVWQYTLRWLGTALRLHLLGWLLLLLSLGAHHRFRAGCVADRQVL